MKTVNVIAYYELKNPLYMSSDIHFRVKFIDRLKFLLFGENCVIRVKDEQAIKRADENLKKFRDWQKDYEQSKERCGMKIKDLITGQIFEYGSNRHHALRISDDGRTLSFENLQNGDGSEYGDYRFIDDCDEQIPEETECNHYGADSYFNIGGFGK